MDDKDNWELVSPTDDELHKLLDIIPVWNNLSLALGVPMNQAKAFCEEFSYKMAGLEALCYWRNGKCDVAKYPTTRRFLLETVDKTEGPYYTIKLKKKIFPPVPELPDVIVPPSSYETFTVVIVIVVLLSLLFLTLIGSCSFSAFSFIACEQLLFTPNHYSCYPWHFPDCNSMESISSDVEDLDNPTKDHFETFNLFKGHEFEGDYVWVPLGRTGTGKSCFCNFILQEDNIFPEAEDSKTTITKTQEASVECKYFEDKRLCAVDTPGFGNTKFMGKYSSPTMEAAVDATHIFVELTRIMYLAKGGISAFFIVVPLDKSDISGLLDLLNVIDILDNYWSHSILVLTHGEKLGGTEEQQYEEFKNLLQDPSFPPKLKNLYEKFKVNKRSVIVEAKNWRKNITYRNGVVKKLCSLSDDITKQYGRYQHNKQSIGWAEFEKAKYNLFVEIMNVTYKILHIKEASGSDDDKQKKIENEKKKLLQGI